MTLTKTSSKKILILLQLLRLLLLLKGKNSRYRSVGVRSLFKRRRAMGDGHNLLNELRFESAMFFNYTRLNYERFDYLLGLVSPYLRKRSMVTAICPKQRLAMTLRHLAIGDSQASLSFAYRCGRATVCIIIRETLSVLVKVLHRQVISAPKTKVQWKTVANGFHHKWNLPHCIGAIDGRHMQVQCPKASGSTVFNYKKTFSVVLMAIASYDYSFLMVDVGAEGSLNDGAVFKGSVMGQKLESKNLNLPDSEPLPDSNEQFGYFFVGDGAFQLREDLMKPYAVRKLSLSEAVYNYRISRARRVVENAFGVLVNRWRIFRQPLCCNVETANLMVLAAICLHNFIIRSRELGCDEEYMPPTLIDSDLPDGSNVQGSWRTQHSDPNGALLPIGGTRSRNASRSATALRRVLTDYVNNEGAVEWQIDSVKKGFWGAYITE